MTVMGDRRCRHRMNVAADPHLGVDPPARWPRAPLGPEEAEGEARRKRGNGSSESVEMLGCDLARDALANFGELVHVGGRVEPLDVRWIDVA